jgi:hypothetical protein
MTTRTRNAHLTTSASNRHKSAPQFSVELPVTELDIALERLARTLAAMKRGPYRRISMHGQRLH